MKKRTRWARVPPPVDKWIRVGRLWKCPGCGKIYRKAGRFHSCVVIPLEFHFKGRPRARALYDAFHATAEKAGGPFRLSIAKSRIGFVTGVTFAAVTPYKNYIRAQVSLSRKLELPRFVRIEDALPWWIHHFVIEDERDLDDELKSLLREAYRVCLNP